MRLVLRCGARHLSTGGFDAYDTQAVAQGCRFGRLGRPAVAAGLLKPGRALADWNDAAFSATRLVDALAAIGAGGAATSLDVVVKAPDIAENGAVVPVEVATTLPNVESIAILAEKNPAPLIALYALTDFNGSLTTRIKMRETAKVRAIVKSGGKLYSAAKEIKVTIGGCGG